MNPEMNLLMRKTLENQAKTGQGMSWLVVHSNTVVYLTIPWSKVGRKVCLHTLLVLLDGVLRPEQKQGLSYLVLFPFQQGRSPENGCSLYGVLAGELSNRLWLNPQLRKIHGLQLRVMELLNLTSC